MYISKRNHQGWDAIQGRQSFSYTVISNLKAALCKSALENDTDWLKGESQKKVDRSSNR